MAVFTTVYIPLKINKCLKNCWAACMNVYSSYRWFVWWNPRGHSSLPIQWILCILQALWGTSCLCSWTVQRRASFHQSPCRRICGLSGTWPWHLDSPPLEPSFYLHTPFSQTVSHHEMIHVSGRGMNKTCKSITILILSNFSLIPDI